MKKQIAFIIIGMLLLVGTAFAWTILNKTVLVDESLYNEKSKDTFSYVQTTGEEYSKVCVIMNNDYKNQKCGIFINENLDNGIKMLTELLLKSKISTTQETTEGTIKLKSTKESEVIK